MPRRLSCLVGGMPARRKEVHVCVETLCGALFPLYAPPCPEASKAFALRGPATIAGVARITVQSTAVRRFVGACSWLASKGNAHALAAVP